MTSIGEGRKEYRMANVVSDPMPGRFSEPARFKAWAARADRWAMERAKRLQKDMEDTE